MDFMGRDMTNVREPSVSGMFYPDDPAVFRKDIGNYMKAPNVKPLSPDIRAVISPHAGYVYSGQVAAYGYKAVSALISIPLSFLPRATGPIFRVLPIWDEGISKRRWEMLR